MTVIGGEIGEGFHRANFAQWCRVLAAWPGGVKGSAEEKAGHCTRIDVVNFCRKLVNSLRRVLNPKPTSLDPLKYKSNRVAPTLAG